MTSILGRMAAHSGQHRHMGRGAQFDHPVDPGRPAVGLGRHAAGHARRKRQLSDSGPRRDPVV